jgi:hypothetical protein
MSHFLDELFRLGVRRKRLFLVAGLGAEDDDAGARLQIPGCATPAAQPESGCISMVVQPTHFATGSLLYCLRASLL